MTSTVKLWVPLSPEAHYYYYMGRMARRVSGGIITEGKISILPRSLLSRKGYIHKCRTGPTDDYARCGVSVTKRFVTQDVFVVRLMVSKLIRQMRRQAAATCQISHRLIKAMKLGSAQLAYLRSECNLNDFENDATTSHELLTIWHGFVGAPKGGFM